MGRIPKRKTERAPPVDRLLKPAIGVALAFFGYYFMQGINTEIPRVDVTDELALREIFFGEGEGKSYAVLCHAPPGDDASISIPISSVFQDARADGTAPAEFVLIDCEYKLPASGKSVAERFKLDLKKRPTIFVSGKVGPPKQIPSKHLKTGNMLVKLLRQMLEPHAAKIESTKELKTKCLNKQVCGLLLKGGKPERYVKDAMSNLLVKYPNVQFASVDSTVLFVSNLEEYIPEFNMGTHRFVVFKKVSGGLEAGSNETEGEGRLITSIAGLQTNGVSFSGMSNLVGGAISGSQQMKKIPSLPAIKTRTKKLEEQERAKRQRKMDQQQRSQQQRQQQQQPQGAFTANDGSREGRKAERERRREEHRKEHNVREKTPEEIAEMERKRRQRMEEEAAKWNIAPEDAPPEGEYIEDDEDGEEEGEYDMDLDEEDEEELLDMDDDDGDEEDEDDVLDLD